MGSSLTFSCQFCFAQREYKRIFVDKWKRADSLITLYEEDGMFISIILALRGLGDFDSNNKFYLRHYHGKDFSYIRTLG